MVVRALVACVIVAVTGAQIHAEQNDAPPKVGDTIFITISGDLAKAYARRVQLIDNADRLPGLAIGTTARVEQQLENGQLRVEHSGAARADGQTTRLVTLTAIVDSSKITTHVSPKGTPLYASPADRKKGIEPRLSQHETKSHRLELSDLKGVKLRIWVLSEEIGD